MIVYSYHLFKIGNNLQWMSLYKLMIIVLNILKLWHDNVPRVNNGVPSVYVWVRQLGAWKLHPYEILTLFSWGDQLVPSPQTLSLQEWVARVSLQCITTSDIICQLFFSNSTTWNPVSFSFCYKARAKDSSVQLWLFSFFSFFYIFMPNHNWVLIHVCPMSFAGWSSAGDQSPAIGNHPT